VNQESLLFKLENVNLVKSSTLPPTAMSFSLPNRYDLFPGLKNKFYFNYGGQGILPQPAKMAIAATYDFLEAEGPFTLKANRWVQEQMDLLRSTWAAEFQVAPASLTLTDSVTSGCNIVLWGLPWQAGDHILLSDCEHPGVIAIVEALQERWGITYSTCPILATLHQGDPLTVIAQHLRPQTRLLVLSHLLWNTGQVLPLQDIQRLGKEKQIPILVDGAQSAGCLPLNLEELGVDYYAFTGHKWFCGPSGLGGLYINPAHLETLQPTYVGWRSLQYNPQGQVTGWCADARRYEVATTAFPLLVGLKEALLLHRQNGTAQSRWQTLNQLAIYLWQGLQAIAGLECLASGPPQAGIVSFRVAPPWTASQLVKRLDSQRFHLRTIADPDCVRACCHYFSTTAEIDSLLDCLKKILLTGPQ
jgi:L-cysteine/cystine lyase